MPSWKILALAVVATSTMLLVSKTDAAVVFGDNFNNDPVSAGPTGWTFTTDVWGNSNLAVISDDSTASGNRAINIPDAQDRGGNMTTAASLGTTLTTSWTATFDYAFHWGDGNSYVGVGISLRAPVAPNSSQYDGYRYMIWMGDAAASAVGKDSNGRFQIESYNGNNAPSGSALVAASDGSHESGYQNNNAWGTSAGIDTMNHGMLTWDDSTHTLTAYYMPAGGSSWTQEAQVIDANVSSFSEVALTYIGSNGVTAALDNVVVTAVPEPLSLSSISVGAVLVALAPTRRWKRRAQL